MSIGKWFGGAAKAPIEAVGAIIDNVYDTETEKMDKRTIMAKVAQAPHLLQAEISKIEAQHRSLFVAGWRPFIGWVCGFGLASHYIINPWAIWIAFAAFDTVLPPSPIEAETLSAMVYALLGLGGLRTVEKQLGRSK